MFWCFQLQKITLENKVSQHIIQCTNLFCGKIAQHKGVANTKLKRIKEKALLVPKKDLISNKLRFTPRSNIIHVSDRTKNVFFTASLLLPIEIFWSVRKKSQYVWNKNIILWKVLEWFFWLLLQWITNSLICFNYLFILLMHCNLWIKIVHAYFLWNNLYVIINDKCKSE